MTQSMNINENEWDQISQLYLDYGSLTTGIHCEYAINNLLPSYLSSDTTTLLDVGCGTGELCMYASGRVKHITAIDSSTQMIDILNKRIVQHNINNITAIQCSCTDLSALYNSGNQQKYDIITCCFVLMYDVDINHTVNELLKLCHNKTIILFVTWNGADTMSWVHRMRNAKLHALNYQPGTMAYIADAPHNGCSNKHDKTIDEILQSHGIQSTVHSITLQKQLPLNMELSEFYDIWYTDQLSHPHAHTIKQCWLDDMMNDMTTEQCKPYFSGNALYRIAAIHK